MVTNLHQKLLVDNYHLFLDFFFLGFSFCLALGIFVVVVMFCGFFGGCLFFVGFGSFSL